MNVTDTIDAEPTSAQRIRIPSGLLGFEHLKDYELIANPDEEPFLWLQVAAQPDLAFLLVPPFLVSPDYHPNIPDDDVEVLGLRAAEDAELLNIVTLRGSSGATVNLKGPIVINRHTRMAKQVVLNNASEYSVQHPMPVAN